MSEYQTTPLLNKKPTLVMLRPAIFSTLSLLLLYSIYSLQVYLNVINLSHLLEFLLKNCPHSY